MGNTTAAPERRMPRTLATSTPAFRQRTYMGAMVPLCIVVALAILCIVIAALTSAHRADEVAIAHEQTMLRNAIAYRGEWSLRKLKTVILPEEDENQAASPPLARLIKRVHVAYKTLLDHDFVLVTDDADRLVHIIVNGDGGFTEILPVAFAQLQPTLAFMRGHIQAPPGRITWLTEPVRTANSAVISEVAFLQTLTDGISVIVSATIDPGDDGHPDPAKPAVLALQFVDAGLLEEFGTRLVLKNLRQIGNQPATGGDAVLELRDRRGPVVARFAWTPQRPAAEVLHSVAPFLAIAIVGFALLTGVLLRYMRRTDAKIAEAETRLRHLAMHDPLCGLPNRILFNSELESTIANVRRGGPSAAVLYIDLDHFKDVNDTLGHTVGDELIRSVSQRLSNCLRGNDLVARLGGDEFAVITTAASDHLSLQTIARRIIDSLCAPYTLEGSTVVIGASIGIASIDANSNDRATDILRFADIALYRAKSEGRNRACIYDTAMDEDISRRKQLEQELHTAIEKDQLEVAYQPVVNASGERIVGVEALARWSHPERGFISPIEFIPLAESSGLIIELGEWVLRRACRDGKAWPGLSIAVNVSPVQFRQADFVEVVERIVAETEFDPRRLELELTESTLIGNVEIAESAMLRLKALGVRLALDDFGTGYSSLLYLRRFPFDKLKIDQSFVHSIENASDAAAIVHAIVSLGRGLGMKVTAEGVENVEQHLFLRAAGVHYMQGYRFGKPTDAAGITASLASSGAHRKIESDAVAAMAG